MREIKFRAWDTVLKKYWYSDKCFFLFLGGKLIERDGDFGQPNKDNDVEQFTGLLDKNGVEIYEGDILLCDDDGEFFPQEYNESKDEYYPVGKYAVIWDSICFDLKNDLEAEENLLWYAVEGARCEVIGNIYEHGHLLDSKTERMEMKA